MSSREELLRFRNWRPPVNMSLLQPSSIARVAELNQASREPRRNPYPEMQRAHGSARPPAAGRSGGGGVWSAGQHPDLAALQRGTQLRTISQAMARIDAIPAGIRGFGALSKLWAQCRRRVTAADDGNVHGLSSVGGYDIPSQGRPHIFSWGLRDGMDANSRLGAPAAVGGALGVRPQTLVGLSGGRGGHIRHSRGARRFPGPPAGVGFEGRGRPRSIPNSRRRWRLTQASGTSFSLWRAYRSARRANFSTAAASCSRILS